MQLFKSGEGRTDDTIQNLLNRHQEDRMDLLRSVETLDLHEAEEIHNDIMEEKSAVLTDQKRRLASMLASLQVQKSREVATLRGQLNALTKVEVRYIYNFKPYNIILINRSKCIAPLLLLSEVKKHQIQIISMRFKLELLFAISQNHNDPIPFRS